MNKKLVILALLLFVSTFSIACQSKTVEKAQEEIVVIKDDEKEVEKVIAEDSSSKEKVANTSDTNDITIEEKTSIQVMDEFKSIKNKSAYEILEFIEKNISYTDSVDADLLITSFISKSKDEIESSNNYLFSGDSLMINDTINKTVVYDGNYSIFAEKKDQLINDLDDEVLKTNLSEIFKRGQGLISAEGSYYAVVDYLDLYNTYADNVSSSLSDYLEIASIETTKPSTVEEYLAISFDELKNRSIRYEKFLMENGSAPYAGEVRLLYMTSLWKVVNPSLFDAQLNDDFTVNEDMINFYNETKDLSEYPVLQDSVNGILKFIDSREGGVVGSLQDSNDIIENARMLHENAANQIDKLYMNN